MGALKPNRPLVSGSRVMGDFFKISLTLWGSDKFNATPFPAKS
jgi:hypothetical protein